MNLLGLIDARLLLDQTNVIFDQSNLFFDQSKIDQRVFKIISFSRVLSLFKLFQKLFLSLPLQSVKIKARFFFFRFSLKNFQGFLSSTAGKTFYPSFFIHFHLSCIFSCILWKVLNLWKIGVFGVFNQFFQNCSLGFCYGMLLN